MTTEREKVWIEKEMAEYDRLLLEMRAAVQEFGALPWHPCQPVEEYVHEQKRNLQAEQEFHHPGLTAYLEPAIQ